jgi:hypothetical protein
MMDWDELVGAYESGDIGDVEFFELALDMGADLKKIEKVLADGRVEL